MKPVKTKVELGFTISLKEIFIFESIPRTKQQKLAFIILHMQFINNKRKNNTALCTIFQRKKKEREQNAL
jgi:hypothetical protein